MWNSESIKVDVLQRNTHFIHVRVSENINESWILTIVYASPKEIERH